MKYIAILIVPLICLVYISSVNAEMTVKGYEFMINSKDEKAVKVVKMYINDVGQGFARSNTELDRRGGKQLYCPNQNLALNADNYIRILNDTIVDLRKRGIENVDDTDIEFFLLLGLKKMFPCPE